MRYLPFADRANARSRTEAIAQALGCGRGHPADGTTQWFRVIHHPGNVPQGALCVPEGEEHRLTGEERGELKDQRFMEGQGWFRE